MYGNAIALKELFEGDLLTNQDLRCGNSRGDTVLHEAARFGTQPFGRNAPLRRRCKWEGGSFRFAQTKVGGEEVIRRNDGCTVLHAAASENIIVSLLGPVWPFFCCCCDF